MNDQPADQQLAQLNAALFGGPGPQGFEAMNEVHSTLSDVRDDLDQTMETRRSIADKLDRMTSAFEQTIEQLP